PPPHLAQAAERIALRFSCAHHSRTDACFGAQEALVIAHRVEDPPDRRLDVDVDPNLVHPFMLHPHRQTAFTLAPATKIDLDHLPELLGEMSACGRSYGRGSPCGSTGQPRRGPTSRHRLLVTADAASRL